MDFLQVSLFNPPILFFFLGMAAVLLKSDLNIPPAIAKLFSLYLLIAIGFNGGVKLAEGGISREVIVSLGAAVMVSALIPVYTFWILRKKYGAHDAGAIAATYGSVSAVTFITATVFLRGMDVEFGGHMVAALALMESPAIIVGIMLVRLSVRDKSQAAAGWGELLKEAFVSAPVFLILGSLLVGVLAGEEGAATLKPFTVDIFKGMLVFFLLDMGIVAAQRIRDLHRAGFFLISFALLAPFANALLGMLIASLLGMSLGNAFLFTVLCASASYIAVPAAMRLGVPEANPSLYVPMSLALTFPLNIIVGIPLYFYLLSLWLS